MQGPCKCKHLIGCNAHVTRTPTLIGSQILSARRLARLCYRLIPDYLFAQIALCCFLPSQVVNSGPFVDFTCSTEFLVSFTIDFGFLYIGLFDCGELSATILALLKVFATQL
jgi:hypothetical protein